ncbi:MAG: hypothetical protein H7844_10080 [Nitrospirae bacterium YQR-1]
MKGRAALYGLAFLVLGVVAGVAVAKYSSTDYYHRTLILNDDAKTTPLYVKNLSGRIVLNLSIKNMQKAENVIVDVKGGRFYSPLPPPVTLLPKRWVSFVDKYIYGLKPGIRIPAYVVLNTNEEPYEITFMRLSDTTVIKRFPIVKGDGHEKHKH